MAPPTLIRAVAGLHFVAAVAARVAGVAGSSFDATNPGEVCGPQCHDTARRSLGGASGTARWPRTN